MTSTPAERQQPETDTPLRPLLARIWRDYLGKRRGTLVLSLVCAAFYAVLTGALAWLLNPAVRYLFPDKRSHALHDATLPVLHVTVTPGQLVWLIPIAVVVA